MNVRIDFNEPKILAKVKNDRFGTLVANEAKRVYDPYTPRDTGLMEETAKIYPWKIHYIQPYSARIYYGRDFNFQHKKNSFILSCASSLIRSCAIIIAVASNIPS